MTTATYYLMLEALRRYCTFHAGEPLNKAWIGLGTTAAYRPVLAAELMKPKEGQPVGLRGVSIWYQLTPAGESIILKWLAQGYFYNTLTDKQNLPPLTK